MSVKAKTKDPIKENFVSLCAPEDLLEKLNPEFSIC